MKARNKNTLLVAVLLVIPGGSSPWPHGASPAAGGARGTVPILGFLIVGMWVLWLVVVCRIARPRSGVTSLETLLFFAAICLFLPGDMMTVGTILVAAYLSSVAIRALAWRMARR